MSGRKNSFQRQLLHWYVRRRRDLPWRTIPPDPYAVLVSEVMLQQTRVSTVIPYFQRFLQEFPTLAHLAAAPEQAVLRQWQGLGYYSRARNLQAAAAAVVAEHGGKIPSDLTALLNLPGVGRYTAGAIASIAFDRPAPILDGNVARLLCRLEKIETDPKESQTAKRLWRLAGEILPLRRVGEFNSALMELGATVCTPRNPRCDLCPVKDFCQARAAGLQDQIPPRRKKSPTPLARRWTFVIRRGNHCLIEQRPPRGRWANLWQFVTVPAGKKSASAQSASRLAGVPLTGLKPLGEIKHALTHRRYLFSAFSASYADPAAISGAGDKMPWFPPPVLRGRGRVGAELIGDRPPPQPSPGVPGEGEDRPPIASRTSIGGRRKWVTLQELADYPLSKPQLMIAQFLAERVQSSA